MTKTQLRSKLNGIYQRMPHSAARTGLREVIIKLSEDINVERYGVPHP